MNLSASSKSDSDLMTYLKAITRMTSRMTAGTTLRYASLEELILKEGVWFKPPVSDELTHKVKRGVIKECYANCLNHMVINPKCGLTYCEGYAYGIVLPVRHAWLVDSEGQVIDPTWPEPGSEYFGIPFKLDYVIESSMKTGIYGLEPRHLLEEPSPAVYTCPNKGQFLAKAKTQAACNP